MSDSILNEDEVCSLMYLQSDWIKELLNDCDKEDREESHFRLLPLAGRTVMWNMCSLLGIQTLGASGQACQLFERYLFGIFKDYSRINDRQARDAMFEYTNKRVTLIMCCCALLVGKIDMASSHLNAQFVRICLLCKGINYSIQQINATERDLFTALKFKIPVWNCVDIAKFLAVCVKLPPKKMRKIPAIVTVAEFYKEAIVNEVKKATHLPPTCRRNGGNIVRNLHLAAGAIAAAAALSPTIEIFYTLGLLVKAPETYIRCLRDAIIKEICTLDHIKSTTTPVNLKRKWTAE